MKKEQSLYGADQIGAIAPEDESTGFESDLAVFGGMTQDEIEAEVDREEAEERRKEFSD